MKINERFYDCFIYEPEFWVEEKLTSFRFSKASGLKGTCNRQIISRVVAVTLPFFSVGMIGLKVLSGILDTSIGIYSSIKEKHWAKEPFSKEYAEIYFSSLGKSLAVFILGLAGVVNPNWSLKLLTIGNEACNNSDEKGSSKKIKIKIGKKHCPIYCHPLLELKNFGIHSDKYEFVEDNRNPDVVFFELEKGKPNKNGANMYGFRMPQMKKRRAIRLFINRERVPLDMTKCDYAITSDSEWFVNHPNHVRRPVYSVGYNSIGWFPKNYEERGLTDEKIEEMFRSRHFCNFVYSVDHPFRVKMYDKLNQRIKQIDGPEAQVCAPGNSPKRAADNHKDKAKVKLGPRNSPHWLTEKREFVKQYKFTLAIENEVSPGYVTEKLIDAIAGNSIPIYHGHPDVLKEFNPNSFIFIDTSSLDKLKPGSQQYEEEENRIIDAACDRVIEVHTDINKYKEMLKAPILGTHPFEIKKVQDLFYKIFDEVLSKRQNPS